MSIYLTQAQPTGIMAMLPSLAMFGLMGLAMYFMLIRPQKKQQEKYKQTMEALKVGDKIVTRGGIRGEIVKINENTLIVKSVDMKFEILKQGLSYVENASTSSAFSSNQPVENLNYGNDKRFTESLEKQKELKNLSIDYDILLEDVYEFVVVERKTKAEDVSNTFRFDESRSNEILNQLQLLDILSEEDTNGERVVLLDPR